MTSSQDVAFTDADTQEPIENSPASDYVQLQHAYLNEKKAPELLPYETSLVERTEARLAEQEETIEELGRANDAQKPIPTLRLTLLQTDVARVRWLLRAYLRARLLKLETYEMHILDQPRLYNQLSDKELHFAKEYYRLYRDHALSVALRHLPEKFQNLSRQFQESGGTERDMIALPNLDEYVFARVMRDLEVELDGEGAESKKLSAGDLWLINYRPIREHVHNKDIRLV